MKVETFQDLIDWTKAVHERLGKCLQHCSDHNEKRLAEALMTYAADHEKAIARTIERFEEHADPRALRTRVYDYLEHQPVDPHRSCDRRYEEMSFEELTEAIFDVHEQVLELYRYLAGRADIPEAQELLEPLLEMEEHETMRLAQQIGRSQDM